MIKITIKIIKHVLVFQQLLQLPVIIHSQHERYLVNKVCGSLKIKLNTAHVDHTVSRDNRLLSNSEIFPRYYLTIKLLIDGIIIFMHIKFDQ